jgi:DNA-binding response OmpR family regulator
MVRLTVGRADRATGPASRSQRVRVVVRRGDRGGGVHVTLAGLTTAASVPRLVHALRWLSANHTTTVASADALRVYPESRTVLRGDESLPLTRREFDLLLFLSEHPHRVFTRRQLLSAVWGHEYASERTIDVHIRRLRVKARQPLVATVYRVGYRLHEDTVATVIRET